MQICFYHILGALTSSWVKYMLFVGALTNSRVKAVLFVGALTSSWVRAMLFVGALTSSWVRATLFLIVFSLFISHKTFHPSVIRFVFLCQDHPIQRSSQ